MSETTQRQRAYRQMILKWTGQALHESNTSFATAWNNMEEPQKMELAVKLATHPGFLRHVMGSERDPELRAPMDVSHLVHYLASPTPSPERSRALAWLIDLLNRAVAKTGSRGG